MECHGLVELPDICSRKRKLDCKAFFTLARTSTTAGSQLRSRMSSKKPNLTIEIESEDEFKDVPYEIPESEQNQSSDKEKSDSRKSASRSD